MRTFSFEIILSLCIGINCDNPCSSASNFLPLLHDLPIYNTDAAVIRLALEIYYVKYILSWH